MNSISGKQWHRLTVVCGISAFSAYFLAAFAPLPDKAATLLAFAFGPLFMLSSLGLFYLLKTWKDSINLRIAVLFNIVATALLTLMLVVQLTSQEFHQQHLNADRGTVSAEQLKWMFAEVNSIQLGMDLAWDIFISIGLFFFAWVMFQHPKMNKIISGLGMLFSALLLVFNLAYFPQPPGEMGSVDFGPFVSLWYLTLMVWLLIRGKSFRELDTASK